jgi:hypothetical protein
MNVNKSLLYSIIILLSVTFGGISSAQDSILSTARVLAVVPVKSGIDQSVYKQFDRLVPELRKIAKDNIVKLECRYTGRSELEQDVINAYQVAGKIEKYLRNQHKLALDLWITIQMGAKQPKATSVLTIALLADDIKRLDSIVSEQEQLMNKD